MDQHSGPVDNESRKPHFVSLLTANYYQIHSFILTMVPNKADAEDILQNTIMFMWEHFEDFKTGTRFLSWAVTVAKFQVLTYRKAVTRSKIHLSEMALDLIAEESAKLCTQVDERYEALQKCLKKLPKRETDFLKKRFMHGDSIRKIADDIGTSLNVVYKRLARLKAILLNCIRWTIASQGV